MLLLGLQEFSHSFHGLAPGDDVTVTYGCASYLEQSELLFQDLLGVLWFDEDIAWVCHSGFTESVDSGVQMLALSLLFSRELIRLTDRIDSELAKE